MEEGADETGDVAIGGALAITIVLSVVFGAISGLLGTIGALNMGLRLSQIVMLAVAAVLLGGVLIARRGGTVWPLRAGWLALLIAFLASDPPMGLFEGGIIMIPAFFAALTGVAASLFSRRGRRV
jgi:hypothetical protein